MRQCFFGCPTARYDPLDGCMAEALPGSDYCAEHSFVHFKSRRRIPGNAWCTARCCDQLCTERHWLCRLHKEHLELSFRLKLCNTPTQWLARRPNPDAQRLDQILTTEASP